jgi:hypothetical protein
MPPKKGHNSERDIEERERRRLTKREILERVVEVVKRNLELNANQVETLTELLNVLPISQITIQEATLIAMNHRLNVDHIDFDNAGVINFSDIKRIGTNVYHGIKNIITTRDIPLRKRFSDSDQALLAKYGTQPLTGITVYRAPLAIYVKPLLNLITLGQYSKAEDEIKKLGIDKVFHLYLVISLKDGTQIKAEKNETPSLTLWKGAFEPDTDLMEVKPFNFDITLNDLIENSIHDMGDDFWSYSAFDNNCIDFGRNLLGSNGMLSRAMDEFLKNPAQSLKKELTDTSIKIAQGATDLSRKARTFFGLGIAFNTKAKYKYTTSKKIKGGGAELYLKKSDVRNKVPRRLLSKFDARFGTVDPKIKADEAHEFLDENVHMFHLTNRYKHPEEYDQTTAQWEPIYIGQFGE